MTAINNDDELDCCKAQGDEFSVLCAFAIMIIPTGTCDSESTLLGIEMFGLCPCHTPQANERPIMNPTERRHPSKLAADKPAETRNKGHIIPPPAANQRPKSAKSH